MVQLTLCFSSFSLKVFKKFVERSLDLHDERKTLSIYNQAENDKAERPLEEEVRSNMKRMQLKLRNR